MIPHNLRETQLENKLEFLLFGFCEIEGIPAFRAS